MEKKVRFYRSVNFKIAFSFILILLMQKIMDRGERI